MIDDQALLKALNAETPDNVQVDLIDPTPVDPDAGVDPLHVKTPVALNAIEQSQAIHSTAMGGEGYAVKIAGEYYAMSAAAPGKKIKKPYETSFNLPDLDAALSVIKNRLLDKRLKRDYPDYVSFCTHKIVEARPRSPQTPATQYIQFMPRETLEAHIRNIQAPIDPASYRDTTMLREAVVDYTMNQKGFPQRQAKKLADIRKDEQLADMNPDPETKPESKTPSETSKIDYGSSRTVEVPTETPAETKSALSETNGTKPDPLAGEQQVDPLAPKESV